MVWSLWCVRIIDVFIHEIKRTQTKKIQREINSLAFMSSSGPSIQACGLRLVRAPSKVGRFASVAVWSGGQWRHGPAWRVCGEILAILAAARLATSTHSLLQCSPSVTSVTKRCPRRPVCPSWEIRFQLQLIGQLPHYPGDAIPRRLSTDISAFSGENQRHRNLKGQK